jgi:DNA-binding CsgD family transcriptional regulator
MDNSRQYALGIEAAETCNVDPRSLAAREISELVSAGTRSLDELLDVCAEIVCLAVADTSIIGVFDDAAEAIDRVGAHDRDPERQARLTAPPAIAPALRGVATGGAWPPALTGGAEIDASLVLPMRAFGACVGIVALARRRPGAPFTTADTVFAEAVTDRLGLAVRILRLEEHLASVDGEDIHDRPSDPRLQTLTAREREIFRLIGSGLSSREIAERLFLSVRTVEWHRRRLMVKLDVTTRSEVIALTRTLRP